MARIRLLGYAVIVLVLVSQGAAQVSIQLNPAVRYQTITGWEATAQAGHENSPGYANYRDELLDRAIDELGINRLRLEGRSGMEYDQDNWTLVRTGQIDNTTWRSVRYATVNDNDDPYSINWAGFQFGALDYTIDELVLPMRQRMAARGRALSVNLCYVAFTSQIGAGLDYNHDDSPQEYAEFVEATYLHMQNKYGFVPDTWEVILEPDNTSFWRGQQIGQAIAAAASRLIADGFTPRFVAPSTTRMSNAPTYFDAMISVPGVQPYLEELSYHRYSGVSDTNLQAIAQRGAQYDVNTSMLEHIGSGYADLHKDLKMGNVSAWQQFTLAFPSTTDDGGKYYVINDSDPNNPQVTLGSRSRYLSQYFRYILEGAVRIDAVGNSQFDPVAFINADGTFVTVIKASAAGTVALSGLPAGQYGITYTTASAYNVSLADVDLLAGHTLTASIPGSGVMTIYQVPGPAPGLVLLGLFPALLRRRAAGSRRAPSGRGGR